MKKCEDEVPKPKFPSLKAGETVEHKNGKVYMSIFVNERVYVDAYQEAYVRLNKSFLVSLQTGSVFDCKSFWGDSKPEDWKKVDYCFKKC